MSFYKQFIVVFFLALFLSACSSDADSIHKSGNKIILSNSNQTNKIITLDENGNGQIIKIETYIDGYLDKSWIPDNNNLSDTVEYYENGKIKIKGYLKNGKQHSLWQYFDRDEHLLIERYFSYGEPTTIWIWYNHHNHDLIDNYELYADIKDDGFLMRYYRSSNIKEEKYYSTSKLTGDYTLFYNAIDSKTGKQFIQLKGQFGTKNNLGIKIGEWQRFEKE